MTSATVASFWDAYLHLEKSVRTRVKKAYLLWMNDPFHPSLKFKCINQEENIWSVRVTRGCRAVGVMDGNTVTWFWIGSHDGYERFFG